MATFVQIVVNVPAVSGIFDYSIPEALIGKAGVGHLVVVPFGKQTVQGVVFRFIEQASVADVKEVIELVDPEPVLTQAQITLAEAMAESTLSSLASVVGLFLPTGLSQEADVRYELRIAEYEDKTSTVATRLVNLLRERGPLRGRQIDTHFRKVDWRKGASYLVRRGVLASQSMLPPARVRPKFIKTAQLAVSPEAAEDAMDDLGRTESTQTRRKKALRFLMQVKDAINVSWVYAESGCNFADLQELEERGLIRLFESEIFRDPLEKAGREVSRSTGTQADHYTTKQEIDLTPEQNSALHEIINAFSSATAQHPFLLQGVTGSGKTEIYLRATEEIIRLGKQAIILVPEIALTPQTVRRFLVRFPGQVGLVHSKLSEGERYDTWRRARAGLLKVIIGPRSALFAPLQNLGLIVADECHDSSYYQAEPPFYHAVTASQMYARLAGAVCILGSATPSIVQRFQAEPSRLPQGDGLGASPMKRLDLPYRIVEAGLPPVQIIDMRDELKAGQRGIFSRLLLKELEATLGRGEQAILFLNRRGTATYIFCRDCGYVLRCPNCDTPLTYHIEKSDASNIEIRPGDRQSSMFGLRCHHCGYERGKPNVCPACGSRQIREYGLGSEKVEAEVSALFPNVRTMRWDWETTRQKESHDMILTHFAAHRADVLIGTQMLAKGLDLPLVTLVGIVLADVGLHLPDPFASERVFQVLTQVAGRAGRSERGGKVVLQTFDANHQVIQSAARHDADGFYEYELEQRKRLGYPPFSRLVRLEYRHHDPIAAQQEAHKVAAKLGELLATDNWKLLTVIGPVPCFFAKIAGLYRWQIVLRGPDPAAVLKDRPVQTWLKDWRVEADPISLL